MLSTFHIELQDGPSQRDNSSGRIQAERGSRYLQQLSSGLDFIHQVQLLPGRGGDLVSDLQRRSADAKNCSRRHHTVYTDSKDQLSHLVPVSYSAFVHITRLPGLHHPDRHGPQLHCDFLGHADVYHDQLRSDQTDRDNANILHSQDHASHHRQQRLLRVNRHIHRPLYGWIRHHHHHVYSPQAHHNLQANRMGDAIIADGL